MQLLEKSVDGAFAVGNKISLADIVIQWWFTDIIGGRHKLDAAVAAAMPECPKLQAICAAVTAATTAYVAGRKPTPF
jgi:hypothetical protein